MPGMQDGVTQGQAGDPVAPVTLPAPRRRRAGVIEKVVTVHTWVPAEMRGPDVLESICAGLIDPPAILPTVSGADLVVRQIQLASEWDDRVDPSRVRGWRMVGSCIYVLDGLFQEGILARSVDRIRYQMMFNRSAVELLRDPVDEWLFTVRGGHHGGPGRCQGVKAPDCTYPRPVAMKLAVEVVAFYAGKGGGQVSLGLREMARQAAAAGRVVPLVRGTRGQATLRVKAYLDDNAIQTFLRFGQGNLSLGVRRLWLAHTQTTPSGLADPPDAS